VVPEGTSSSPAGISRPTLPRDVTFAWKSGNIVMDSMSHVQKTLLIARLIDSGRRRKETATRAR